MMCNLFSVKTENNDWMLFFFSFTLATDQQINYYGFTFDLFISYFMNEICNRACIHVSHD